MSHDDSNRNAQGLQQSSTSRMEMLGGELLQQMGAEADSSDYLVPAASVGSSASALVNQILDNLDNQPKHVDQPVALAQDATKSTPPNVTIIPPGNPIHTATSPSRAPHSQSPDLRSVSSTRQCWICYMTEEDETNSHWLKPCKCIGGTKWVHLRCLQSWVNEKLKENKDRKVSCPQCKTTYLIIFPKVNLIVRFLDCIDRMVYRACPFVTAGVVLGVFYWNAVTYGTIMVSHVLGEEEYYLMEEIDPSVTLVALPFIPISLVVLEILRWEDTFLRLLRELSKNLPIVGYLLPNYVMNENGEVVDPQVENEINLSRILASALLLPVIAKFCGNIFFPSVTSIVHRTFLGGASFILAKGIIRMYHKQQVYKRLSKRRILDYTEENVRFLQTARPFLQANAATLPWQAQPSLEPINQLD